MGVDVQTPASSQLLTDHVDSHVEVARLRDELALTRRMLDDAIKLWERGEELYKLCVSRLDAAQGKIEELGKRIESDRPA